MRRSPRGWSSDADLNRQLTRNARALQERHDAIGREIHFARLSGELASEHEPVDGTSLAAYASKVPLNGALTSGLAMGPVYMLPDVEGKPAGGRAEGWGPRRSSRCTGTPRAV